MFLEYIEQKNNASNKESMTAQNPSLQHTNTPSITVTDDRPKAVLEAQKILKVIADGISSTVQGLERQMFISDMMSRTDDTVRAKLQSLMNYLLSRMISLGASDIDIGGYRISGMYLVSYFRIEET